MPEKMIVRPTKRDLINKASAIRSLTAVVCLLSLVFFMLAIAVTTSPGHAGPGLLWANLVSVFIFFATVVIVSLICLPEEFRLPACEWTASVNPRAPPSY